MTTKPDKTPLMVDRIGDADVGAVDHLESARSPNEDLEQELNTHLIFISLGFAIGTGIFLGVDCALTTAGPVGLIFAVICSVVICVMFSVGEMVPYLPVVNAHLRVFGHFIDPSLIVAMP